MRTETDASFGNLQNINSFIQEEAKTDDVLNDLIRKDFTHEESKMDFDNEYSEQLV